MRLGLGPLELSATSASDLRGLAESAAAASFDCVWVAESRAGGAGAGLATAAMVAQWVPIRVGAVVDVGLYHPLHLAEDIAVADLTSGGRLEVMLRPAVLEYEVLEEHVRVLASVLSGAHVQFNGRHLRVPARLEANQPVPERLALNPRPAQPVVPIWLLGRDPSRANLADDVGFGVAWPWSTGLTFGPSRWRLPRAVLCPAEVQAPDLLAAAGDNAGYFLVEAATPDEVAAAGRRLAGPLRMPEFPAWVNE